MRLKNTVVASWFNGGVRIFRVADAAGIAGFPPHLDEIGYCIPAAPPGNPGKLRRSTTPSSTTED